MAVGLLEYSEDPLSDATPTYVDVTSYVVGAVQWGDGKARDLEDPAAGSMSFLLRNANREWEPEFSGAVFDAKPLRRFRWSVDGVAEGVWYATSWRVTWPAGTSFSVVEVSCVDGFELLSLDALDLLDPPTASAYEEVVMADAPFAYYKLNEQGGTALVATAGNEGVYGVGTYGVPLFGQTGLITGSSDTSVEFGINERGQVVVEANQFVDAAGLSVEVWLDHVTIGTDPTFLTGPANAAASDFIFSLDRSGGLMRFGVLLDGTATPVYAESSRVAQKHWVGTWDGQTVRIYADGVLRDSVSAVGALETGDAGGVIAVGNASVAGADAWLMAHAAFYEHALSQERIVGHFNAGSGGFAAQTAGERIAAVVASALWAETEIEAGEHTVQAVMEHGQSKLDEIKAAVKAEMPESLFFFNGDGDPVYRAWNYKDGLGPLATFGAGAGEIGYQAIEPVYDDEIFNAVTVGHEAGPGEETQHTEIDQDSIDAYFRRTHAETGLILADHQDAIAVAAAILERHHEPMQRFASITINGSKPAALTQILARELGDLIRIKGLSASGTPIDVVTTIVGRSKTLDASGHLVCTWNTARGFSASAGNWQLGISGFSELGTTTVLA